MAVDINYNSWY